MSGKRDEGGWRGISYRHSMNDAQEHAAAGLDPSPEQISPLSCVPLVAGVVVFTMMIAWLIGWWLVSSNEHNLQRNMLDIARAAAEYRDRFGEYPDSFEQISEYSIMVNPPRNPYSGEPTRFLTPGEQPSPGDISLHRLDRSGNDADLLIVGYGLRPVPRERRSGWAELPDGIDPEKVLSAISVNGIPPEMLAVEVKENSAAEQAAERWKLPEDS